MRQWAPVGPDLIVEETLRAWLGVEIGEIESRAVTRTLSHRHTRWRAGVALHWSASCPQMTGRSQPSSRTIQLSVEQSDILDSICTGCRPRRSRDLTQIVVAGSLVELLERYMPAGDTYGSGTGWQQQAEQAERHARRAAQQHPQAEPLARAVQQRRALPAVRAVHTALREQAWYVTPHPGRDTLLSIGAGGALPRLRDIPQGPRPGQAAQIERVLDDTWTEVPAGRLATVASTATAGSSTYRQLHRDWSEAARTAAASWLAERDRMLRRDPKETLLVSSVDINDPDSLSTWDTPQTAGVAVHHDRGVRLYSTFDSVAAICTSLLPEGTCAVVGEDSAAGRQTGLLAVRLVADEVDEDIQVAVEAARAALR